MSSPLALWHLSARKSALQAAQNYLSHEGYCTVRALYSLVSTGTERRVALGQVPATLYADMQVPHMEGSFDFPVKYGYSLVGTIEEGPETLIGKTVHLLHPHQEWCTVPVDDVFVVPDGIPPLRAILASNLETALNAVWDAQVSAGDRVLVVGFGIIGSLTARLLRAMPAVQVSIAELHPARQQFAQQMGFTLADPNEKAYDLAFHTSASSTGLQQCVDAVGFEGKVIEMSWYGDQPVTVHLGGTFHSQRKQIISAQVSYLPANRQSRWTYQRRKAVVFALLQDAAFDQHITDTIDFKQLPALFDQIRQGDLSALCWGVAY